ncbi:MAG: hypothetical protein GC186_16470 [Rhodobacteraceae bacterium]|nr:hypothetical protein [Paracoccaceae bacterium]
MKRLLTSTALPLIAFAPEDGTGAGAPPRTGFGFPFAPPAAPPAGPAAPVTSELVAAVEALKAKLGVIKWPEFVPAIREVKAWAEDVVNLLDRIIVELEAK